MSVNIRQAARLTDLEARAMLEAAHKVQVATINSNGTPHLVTMFYVLVDGRMAFWTYRASQKARNLQRDPRLTCLIEDGEDYFELRGLQIAGVAHPIDDPDEVAQMGARVVRATTGRPPDETAGYVTHAARKRRAYVVEPTRVISWDHRKLVHGP